MNINNLFSYIRINIALFQIIVLSLLIINSNMHVPCLPEIQNFYHTSEQVIQISFILNPLTAIFVSLGYGVSADFYGRKPILLWSLSFFILGTLFIICFNSLPLFLLGRFFQALGDAGGAIVGVIIIGDYYRGKTYAKIQAILSIALALSWSAAPIIGKNLFEIFGWQGNFAFIFIFSLFVFIPLCFWKEKRNVERVKNNIFSKLLFIIKKWPTTFDTYFIMLSLLQALPLGIFAAFELMFPFIYREQFGDSMQGTSFFLFIFITLNSISSFLYMLAMHYNILKNPFKISLIIFIFYLIGGLAFFAFGPLPSKAQIYLIFGLLSFSLPVMVIASSTKIADAYNQQLGLSTSFLAILRNTGTTLIPLLTFAFSENTFYSFFHITLLPALITAWLLYRIIRINHKKPQIW